jgi:hypothetical protein
MKEIEVAGRPPSPESQFWRQAIQEIRKDSLKTVTDTTRQLIALVTLLSGLCFHAITFTQAPQGYTDVKVLFVGPLLLWMFCLLLATLVLFPFPHQASPYAPEEAEQLIRAARYSGNTGFWWPPWSSWLSVWAGWWWRPGIFWTSTPPRNKLELTSACFWLILIHTYRVSDVF